MIKQHLMKPFKLLGGCFAVVASAWAGPIPTCVSGGTYASYEMLTNGCVINNLLFTNFSDSEQSGGPVAPLTASGITVGLDSTLLDEGLVFNSSWIVSGTESLLSTLNYDVQILDTS